MRYDLSGGFRIEVCDFCANYILAQTFGWTREEPPADLPNEPGNEQFPLLDRFRATEARSLSLTLFIALDAIRRGSSDLTSEQRNAIEKLPNLSVTADLADYLALRAHKSGFDLWESGY